MTVVSQAAWYRRGAGKVENKLGALVRQLNDIAGHELVEH
jgi:beta-mannosidase